MGEVRIEVVARKRGSGDAETGKSSRRDRDVDLVARKRKANLKLRELEATFESFTCKSQTGMQDEIMRFCGCSRNALICN